MITFVMSMSARDGVGSPEGWLWTRQQEHSENACLAAFYGAGGGRTKQDISWQFGRTRATFAPVDPTSNRHLKRKAAFPPQCAFLLFAGPCIVQRSLHQPLGALLTAFGIIGEILAKDVPRLAQNHSVRIAYKASHPVLP